MHGRTGGGLDPLVLSLESDAAPNLRSRTAATFRPSPPVTRVTGGKHPACGGGDKGCEVGVSDREDEFR